jgi:Cysteine-rich secretory protein family
MRVFVRGFLLVLALTLPALAAAQWNSPAPGGSGDLRAAAEQIFALANQARAQAGVGRLQWDPALATAALQHCRRMASEGPIAHRYGGEPDVSGRAAQAGARFSLIEENVAVGPSADAIHEEWMQSPGHRANLLSPDVDHVGIAVVSARGVLYAVADYSRAVQQLSAAQVEARVAALIRVSGVAIRRDPSVARAACVRDEGMPRSAGGPMPRFIMRWQGADLTRLPQALVDRLATGNYRQAAVGSCPAQIAEGAFAAYRVAVLLY